MSAIYTASIGSNAEMFPNILKLYVKEGSAIADVNYGKGVFWRQVDISKYKFLPSDLKDGVDMCKLPYEDASLDALVMDPPYMPTRYTGIDQFSDYYGIKREFTGKKWHDGVLEMYHNGMKEASRVLTKQGTMIIKCQDMVCANKQILVHNDLIQYGDELGFRCEDIFILVQSNKRPHPQKHQVHARKNHSYFLILLRKNVKWDGIRYDSV
jgi:tRNA G10  N-methylase Trm11